jgi:hypothetical protein
MAAGGRCRTLPAVSAAVAARACRPEAHSARSGLSPYSVGRYGNHDRRRAEGSHHLGNPRLFDEKISEFRAEQVLEVFLQKLGPAVYNQAVQDARKFMQSRLDDLEGEVYASDVF